jgi:hypothetical protein
MKYIPPKSVLGGLRLAGEARRGGLLRRVTRDGEFRLGGERLGGETRLGEKGRLSGVKVSTTNIKTATTATTGLLLSIPLQKPTVTTSSTSTILSTTPTSDHY